MKVLPIFITSIFTCFLSAQTVYTIPQGFTRITIPAATSPDQPSLTAISATLLNQSIFAGSVTVGAFNADPDSNPATPEASQSITAAGASWTSGQFTSAPHLAYIVNANDAEEAFLITSHTSDTLTLDVSFNLLDASRFDSDTTVKIRPANTIGALLGTTSTPFTPNDQVFLWDGQNWQSYIPFNGNWFLGSGPNAGTVATDTIIYPEEGLFVQRSENSAATIAFLGEVPVKPQASTVSGNASFFVSTRFPVGNAAEGTPSGIPLPDLNIDTIPNWSVDDNVYVWSGTDWTGFIEFGGDWFFATGPDAGTSANSFLVSAETAVFITRQSSGSASASALSVPLPYAIQLSE